MHAFKKLDSKIKTIIIISLYSILLSGLFLTNNAAQSILKDNYIEQSVSSSNQMYKNAQLYMNLVEETSHLVTDDMRVKDALKSSIYSYNMTPILDGIINSNLNISGLTLYANNGIVYFSSVSNPPSLDNMLKNESLEPFIQSSQTTMWRLRTKAREVFYTNPQYISDNNDLLSLFIKIRDDNHNTIGYLLVDTALRHFFNFFHKDNALLLKEMDTYFIKNKKNILPSPNNKKTINNEETTKLLLNANKGDNNNEIKGKTHILVYNQVPDSDLQLVFAISLNPLYERLKPLCNFLSLICIFFATISLFAVIQLTKTITVPLDRLFIKMQKLPQSYEA